MNNTQKKNAYCFIMKNDIIPFLERYFSEQIKRDNKFRDRALYVFSKYVNHLIYEKNLGRRKVLETIGIEPID